MPENGRKSFLTEDEKQAMIRKKDEVDGKKSPEVKILKPEVTLMLILGQVTKSREVLEEIRDIFKGASKTPKVKPEVTNTEAGQAPKPEEPRPAVPNRASDRILEIRLAFKPLEDLVSLDEATSAMFVLVKPKGFLGGDKFAKVGAASKKLGGDYVSQGRESHFRIPKQTKPPTSASPATATAVSNGIKSVSDVESQFPEDLRNMLNFTEKDDYVLVKPRQFLGSDNFAKIASIIREIGGEYVSAGKDSHFRVKK